MKLIDTKTHGYLDYILGIFLIALPSLLNLNPEGVESTVLYIVGATVILYSLFTNYELGFMRLIPMKVHLMLDTLSGIFLAVSPWLLDFSHVVYAPHLILGIIEIGAALMTNPKRTIEVKV